MYLSFDSTFVCVQCTLEKTHNKLQGYLTISHGLDLGSMPTN